MKLALSLPLALAGALAGPSALAQTVNVNLGVDAVEAPAEAQRGQTIRVRLGLEAIGAPASASYAVLLTQGGVRAGAQELARLGPVSLPAGTLVPLAVDVALPAGLTGIRTLAVEVDPADVVRETNENDNLAFASAETLIRAPRADLAVSQVSLSSTRAPVGSTIDVGFRVENRGELPASAPASIVLSRDRVPTVSDRELGRSMVSVAAEATQNEQVSLRLPADLAAGPWWVGVLLDPDGALGPGDPAARVAVAPSALTVVRADLVLLTRSLPDAVLGRTYAASLLARGGDGTVDFSIDGALPDGLGYDPATQLVSGVPSRTGDFSFRVTARSGGLEDAADLGIRVRATGLELRIATSTLAVGFVTRPYLQRLVAGGGEPPYTWSIRQGALPPGLVLDPAGAIAGTPEALGTAPLTLEVEDRTGATRSAEAVLLVDLTPEVLIETRRVDARVGEPLDAELTAIGGVRPLVWRAETTPPPGLELSREGRLTGTPSEVGAFPFQASATDATQRGVRDLAFVQVVVSDPGGLRITSGPPEEVRRLVLYEHVLTAEGGTPPYSWALVPGDNLPPGFFLAPGPERQAPEGTGVIYGQAFDELVSAFTVRVEDASGRQAEQPLVLFAEAAGQRSAQGDGCRDAGPLTGGAPMEPLFPLVLLAALLWARRRSWRSAEG